MDVEQRAVVFGARATGRVEETTVLALQALRGIAAVTVVVHPGPVPAPVRAALEGLVDHIVEAPGEEFSSESYLRGWESVQRSAPDVAEVVFTGDSWFGPVADLEPLLARMASPDVDVWDIVPPPPERESFPDEGFPVPLDRPWLFTAVRRTLLDSVFWERWWQSGTSHDRERTLVEMAVGAGFRHRRAFDTTGLHPHDPALFVPEDLLELGVPFVDRAVFTSYPPFLDRYAILGSEIADMMAERGYPLDALRGSLATCMPPKALNTNLGLLSVLPEEAIDGDGGSSLSLAAVVHISDPDEVDEILRRLQFLPRGASVFVTTTEGVTAARLERVLEAWAASTGHTYELRVTPQSPGRDMADFFVGCRDVIQSDRYDLVFKLHLRRAPWKTMNRLRYFRRYQFDNLLSSPGYVRNILGLFEHEPRLGVVFPPMIHIGYSTMGRGWAMLQRQAERLCAQLGIRVPLDMISPLGPYGGMWVGRPAAFRSLTAHRWTFADYGWRSERRFGHLAHLQERVISAAAGQMGYYCRTVLNFAHAEISYTALEFKVDQLFSTTRGWPVEQIRFLHRAGYTGYGGTVALVRMYVRTNHPGLANAIRPAYRAALRAHRILSAGRRVARRFSPKRDENEREAAT
ncbi:rhamnan synthesis F family protein [Microbacterium sp. ACRRU]|uniref:rhamnan synthesis F family protein n=1 Tax=Microbacterium sp. ACRRU TaxID=2918204 RepID=UPI001EF6584B|nr:rhamnan synthesis F family protein [Microbacterium sp. ACRRU]MCG7418135.1 rhamnan synthesis F family protein [Microbacterium sp. ACRRU]